MKCPMKMNSGRCDFECEKDRCAWWCSWANCCAVVVISREAAKRNAYSGGCSYAGNS